MKWPEPLTKPTGEYIGGILAGLGLGALVWRLAFSSLDHVLSSNVSWLIGFSLIGMGAGLARAGQRAKVKKEKPANTNLDHIAGSR